MRHKKVKRPIDDTIAIILGSMAIVFYIILYGFILWGFFLGMSGGQDPITAYKDAVNLEHLDVTEPVGSFVYAGDGYVIRCPKQWVAHEVTDSYAPTTIFFNPNSESEGRMAVFYIESMASDSYRERTDEALIEKITYMIEGSNARIMSVRKVKDYTFDILYSKEGDNRFFMERFVFLDDGYYIIAFSVDKPVMLDGSVLHEYHMLNSFELT